MTRAVCIGDPKMVDELFAVCILCIAVILLATRDNANMKGINKSPCETLRVVSALADPLLDPCHIRKTLLADNDPVDSSIRRVGLGIVGTRIDIVNIIVLVVIFIGPWVGGLWGVGVLRKEALVKLGIGIAGRIERLVMVVLPGRVEEIVATHISIGLLKYSRRPGNGTLGACTAGNQSCQSTRASRSLRTEKLIVEGRRAGIGLGL